MNTPRFKLRKMQTQMVHEREYKDGLTRELSSLMTQIAQKGTQLSILMFYLISFRVFIVFVQGDMRASLDKSVC